jgi:predicted metal-dependent enzyme (double-stranded beta helix superfamily)
MSTTAVYTLQDFVRDAQAIVARGLAEQPTIELISEQLLPLIARQDCLADFEGNDSADPDRGFPIFRADNLAIMAVVWGAGSGAPIHNHNGWAVEGVISGKEINRNYQRLDDGAEPWRAQLEEVDPSEVRAGETTSLSLPPNDIHAVEIPDGKTLALHVYGVDLPRQWRYRFDIETGEVSPFRIGMRVPTPARN